VKRGFEKRLRRLLTLSVSEFATFVPVLSRNPISKIPCTCAYHTNTHWSRGEASFFDQCPALDDLCCCVSNRTEYLKRRKALVFLFLPMTYVIVCLTATLFWITRFQQIRSLMRAATRRLPHILPTFIEAQSVFDMAGHQVTCCSRHFNKRSEFGKTKLERSKYRTSQLTASSSQSLSRHLINMKLLLSPYFNPQTLNKTLRVWYI